TRVRKSSAGVEMCDEALSWRSKGAASHARSIKFLSFRRPSIPVFFQVHPSHYVDVVPSFMVAELYWLVNYLVRKFGSYNACTRNPIAVVASVDSQPHQEPGN